MRFQAHGVKFSFSASYLVHIIYRHTVRKYFIRLYQDSDEIPLQVLSAQFEKKNVVCTTNTKNKNKKQAVKANSQS